MGHNRMGDECSFGFADLYKAAFGHNPPDSVIMELLSLDQETKNAKVRQWAALAGWGTDERRGTDGLMYTAFSPTWKPKRDC